MQPKLLVMVVVTLVLLAFAGIVLAQEVNGPPQPQFIEDTIHVPKDTGADDYADNVRKANDHGYFPFNVS